MQHWSQDVPLWYIWVPHKGQHIANYYSCWLSKILLFINSATLFYHVSIYDTCLLGLQDRQSYQNSEHFWTPQRTIAREKAQSNETASRQSHFSQCVRLNYAHRHLLVTPVPEHSFDLSTVYSAKFTLVYSLVSSSLAQVLWVISSSITNGSNEKNSNPQEQCSPANTQTSFIHYSIYMWF